MKKHDESWRRDCARRHEQAVEAQRIADENDFVYMIGFGADGLPNQQKVYPNRGRDYSNEFQDILLAPMPDHV